ncbi:MAG: cellulase family glycosylhydrolase [Paucibacter sp.]|nr:cellulase family glycosylhydrolase [Roseateles sp.]
MMKRSPALGVRAMLLVLALVLIAGAAADPSGLFAPIGWTGHPIALWWWWLPYVVQLPLLLGLAWAGGRAVLSLPKQAWWRRGFKLWAVILLASAGATVITGVALLTPMVSNKTYVLPIASSLAFVLWSCGYTVMKMALLGLLPALVGACAAPRIEDRQRPADTEAVPVGLGVELALLLLALLGPWLAAHWWQGSPLGYAYAGELLIAPTPAAGVWQALVGLALVGAVLWLFGLRRDAQLPLAARLWSAGCASVAASLLLLIVQGLSLAHASSAAGRELWTVPAFVARALEAGGFALVLALLAALATWLAGLIRVRRWPHASWGLWLVALLITAGLASRFDAQTPALPALPASELPAQASGLAPLHVATTESGPRLVDAQGAIAVLHGVNVNQLGEYFRRDPALPSALPLVEQDFADMAALGMNVVRLTLSWSLLEPQPGQVSVGYLARIRQAVDWARAHGVYVLLDVHQDGWGVHVNAPAGTHCRPGADPMTGWDGAPAWATLTDGTDPCQVTGRDMAPNVSRAFQSFYMDREGIQGHLVQAWATLAGAFADDTTVVGYDLLNEPNFAETPPIASTLLLANYHARAIAAIRAAEGHEPGGYAHPVFIEPSIFWSGFGLDNLPPRDFTSDTQLVFAPHLYNESITSDQDLGVNFVSIEHGYELALAAARRLGMPLWIGEWGFFKSPEREAPLLDRQLAAEAAEHIGSAFWVWKQGCSDPHVWPGPVAGNLRQWRCPQMQEIGTQRAIAGPLSRAALRSVPAAGAQLSQEGHRLVLRGQWRGAVGPAACKLTLWMPGAAEPHETHMTGAVRAFATQVPAGQASLGPSGGWLLRYCVEPGDYRIELPAAP